MIFKSETKEGSSLNSKGAEYNSSLSASKGTFKSFSVRTPHRIPIECVKNKVPKSLFKPCKSLVIRFIAAHSFFLIAFLALTSRSENVDKNVGIVTSSEKLLLLTASQAEFILLMGPVYIDFRSVRGGITLRTY